MVTAAALVTAASTPVLAKDPPPVIVEAIQGKKVVDVLPLGDGRAVYLTEQHGPALAKSDDELAPFDSLTDSAMTFARLFADVGDPKAFYAVALLGKDGNDGFGVYRYAGDEVQMVAFTREALREPTFHQAPGGDVYAASRTGVSYRFDGKSLHRFSLPWPQGERISFRKLFRRIEFASWPDGPTCLYSIADREFHKLALFDLVVSSGSDWKTIPLNLKFTGPGCMIDADTFRMLLFDRWVNVDLKTAKVTETKFKTPGDPADKLRATKVVVMPDGTLISIWRRPFRSFRKYDVEPFADGTFHRIAIWKDDHWELAPFGIDRQLYRPSNHTIDKQGGLWMLGGEGTLVYYSAEEGWRQFTSDHGLPAEGVLRLSAADDRLWITYGNKAFANINARQLLAQAEKPKPRWRVFYAQAIDIKQSEDAWPLVTTDRKVVAIGPQGVEQFALPDAEGFAGPTTGITAWYSADGVVSLVSAGGETLSRRIGGEWVSRPFQSMADVDLPARRLMVSWNVRSQAAEQVFSSSPLPSVNWKAFRLYRRAMVSDGTTLAYFDGDRWATAPLAGCPLFVGGPTNEGIEFSSAHGRWVIQQKLADTLFRYAIYDPPAVQIIQENADLGDIESHLMPLKPAWTSDAELTDAKLRYRIDEGPWSPWQSIDQVISPGAITPPGKHQLHIEMHSLTQVLSNASLSFSFNVAYDIREDVAKLVKQLGDDDFEVRQFAMRRLARFGPLIHDYLRELAPEQSDAEIRARLRQILGD